MVAVEVIGVDDTRKAFFVLEVEPDERWPNPKSDEPVTAILDAAKDAFSDELPVKSLAALLHRGRAIDSRPGDLRPQLGPLDGRAVARDVAIAEAAAEGDGE